MSNINKVIAGLKFFKEKLFNGIFREHIGVFDDAIEIIENAPENRKPCEFCCDMKSINEVSEKFDISVQYCPVCGRKIPSGGLKYAMIMPFPIPPMVHYQREVMAA